ncbi:hypothetical protein LQ948_18515 [Jiella sp. MQZ9-1]|uniref:Uncharacterized protein n=1 Tax=Jiella flava TaxID=2816857 RepID=A0A939G2V6_9HYPH|nr:hypothetical protein [Jiella flava]MBO0664543.1 hypothetical protein [Jiella flava]MCD2473189.1 hypothetical protein [Jiella flava]
MPEFAPSQFVATQKRWLKPLGIVDRPWLILGSAPDPTIPDGILATHARIDINNVGRTAQAMGLGQADLTVRAKKKSWEEHPHIDTRMLLWIHTVPALVLPLLLIGKPYDHIGRVRPLRRRDRENVVLEVSGVPLEGFGDLGKVTNGVAMACYGLLLGVPEIVLSGISLSKVGHSYDQLGRRRRQVDEDRAVLTALAPEPRLSTSEADLAAESGIRLWSPS